MFLFKAIMSRGRFRAMLVLCIILFAGTTDASSYQNATGISYTGDGVSSGSRMPDSSGDMPDVGESKLSSMNNTGVNSTSVDSETSKDSTLSNSFANQTDPTWAMLSSGSGMERSSVSNVMDSLDTTNSNRGVVATDSVNTFEGIGGMSHTTNSVSINTSVSTSIPSDASQRSESDSVQPTASPVLSTESQTSRPSSLAESNVTSHSSTFSDHTSDQSDDSSSGSMNLSTQSSSTYAANVTEDTRDAIASSPLAITSETSMMPFDPEGASISTPTSNVPSIGMSSVLSTSTAEPSSIESTNASSSSYEPVPTAPAVTVQATDGGGSTSSYRLNTLPTSSNISESLPSYTIGTTIFYDNASTQDFDKPLFQGTADHTLSETTVSTDASTNPKMKNAATTTNMTGVMSQPSLESRSNMPNFVSTSRTNIGNTAKDTRDIIVSSTIAESTATVSVSTSDDVYTVVNPSTIATSSWMMDSNASVLPTLQEVPDASGFSSVPSFASTNFQEPETTYKPLDLGTTEQIFISKAETPGAELTSSSPLQETMVSTSTVTTFKYTTTATSYPSQTENSSPIDTLLANVTASVAAQESQTTLSQEHSATEMKTESMSANPYVVDKSVTISTTLEDTETHSQYSTFRETMKAPTASVAPQTAEYDESFTTTINPVTTNGPTGTTELSFAILFTESSGSAATESELGTEATSANVAHTINDAITAVPTDTSVATSTNSEFLPVVTSEQAISPHTYTTKTIPTTAVSTPSPSLSSENTASDSPTTSNNTFETATTPIEATSSEMLSISQTLSRSGTSEVTATRDLRQIDLSSPTSVPITSGNIKNTVTSSTSKGPSTNGTEIPSASSKPTIGVTSESFNVTQTSEITPKATDSTDTTSASSSVATTSHQNVDDHASESTSHSQTSSSARFTITASGTPISKTQVSVSQPNGNTTQSDYASTGASASDITQTPRQKTDFTGVTSTITLAVSSFQSQPVPTSASQPTYETSTSPMTQATKSTTRINDVTGLSSAAISTGSGTTNSKQTLKETASPTHHTFVSSLVPTMANTMQATEAVSVTSQHPSSFTNQTTLMPSAADTGSPNTSGPMSVSSTVAVPAITNEISAPSDTETYSASSPTTAKDSTAVASTFETSAITSSTGRSTLPAVSETTMVQTSSSTATTVDIVTTTTVSTPHFTSKTIPSNSTCTKIVETDASTGDLTFATTGIGKLSASQENCSHTNGDLPQSPKAVRYCSRNGEWGNIAYRHCSLTATEMLSLLQKGPSTSEQETLLVLNVIAHKPDLDSNDIVTFSKLLMMVANSSGKVEAEVTDVFADNVNRAIDMLESITNDSQKSDSLRILGETIERFVLKQDVAEKSYDVSKRHFKIEIFPLPSNTDEGLSYNASQLSIGIPKKALDIQGVGGDSKVAIITFADASLFPSTRNPTNAIVSVVIGDSNGAANISNLHGDAIHIEFDMKTFSNFQRERYQQDNKPLHLKGECVFYDYITNSWSTDGGNLDSFSDAVRCNWNHATSFTVFVSPVFETQKPGAIVPVGSAVATVVLLIVVSIYLAFWRLRQDPIDVITLNVSLTMSGAFLTHFCSGVLWGSLPRTDCLVLSTIHHFFLLSSFVWMGVMAFAAYKCLFEPKKWVLWIALADEHFTVKMIWKFCAFAYGLAFIVWGASSAGWMLSYENITTEVDGTTLVSGYAYSEADYCFVKDWALAGGLAIPAALVLLFTIIVQIMILRARFAGNGKLKASFRGYYTQYVIAIELAERSIIMPIIMSLPWSVQFIRASVDDFTPNMYTILDIVFGSLAIICSIVMAMLVILRPRHVREILRKVAVRGCSLSEGSYYLDHEGPNYNYDTGPVADPVPTITLPFGTTVTAAAPPQPSMRIGIREDLSGTGFMVKRWRPSDSVAQPDFVLTRGKLGLKGFRQTDDFQLTTFRDFGNGAFDGKDFEEVSLDQSINPPKENSRTGNNAAVDSSPTMQSQAKIENSHVEPTYAKINKVRKMQSRKNFSTFTPKGNTPTRPLGAAQESIHQEDSAPSNEHETGREFHCVDIDSSSSSSLAIVDDVAIVSDIDDDNVSTAESDEGAGYLQ